MKSTAKVVSIILPCRNADPVLLGRAVDSVLAQTFAEYELLILDDGSDEDFQESLRAEAAKDGRIRLIRQEPSGVSAARNRGIREAEGEYITLLDADDTVSAWFLEEAVEAARKLKADFVIGGTCYIYDGQSVPKERGAEGLDPVKDAVLLSRERALTTEWSSWFSPGMCIHPFIISCSIFFSCSSPTIFFVFIFKTRVMQIKIQKSIIVIRIKVIDYLVYF